MRAAHKWLVLIGILLALSSGASESMEASNSLPPAPFSAFLPVVNGTSRLMGRSLSGSAENWLERLNNYRRAAGLPPVVEEAALTAGLNQHIHYMLLNLSPETMWNGETPDHPGYSLEGQQAAAESNLFAGNAGNATPAKAIDQWMKSVTHRYGMLNPGLVFTGFAFDCDERLCAAGLNVLQGLSPEGNGLTEGVVYPGPNQAGVDPDIVVSWQFSLHSNAVLAGAVLSAPSGAPVAATISAPQPDDYFKVITLAPNQPLKPNATYTARMVVILDGKTVSRKWSFTTGSSLPGGTAPAPGGEIQTAPRR